jgi:hypothetical protein
MGIGQGRRREVDVGGVEGDAGRDDLVDPVEGGVVEADVGRRELVGEVLDRARG